MTEERKAQFKMIALQTAMNLRSDDYKPNVNLALNGAALPPRKLDEAIRDAELIYQFLTK
jgi:hypothetical protein